MKPFVRSSKGLLLALATALPLWAVPGSAAVSVSINEVDSSTLQYAANTEGFQFVEISGTAGESLNGVTLVFFNGANNRIYRTVSLDGYRIGSNGLFVVGNPGVPNVDLVVPALANDAAGAAFQSSDNSDVIQPGPDAVALFCNNDGAFFNPEHFQKSEPGKFPLGKLVRGITGESGIMDAGQPETLADALVYTSFTAPDDVELLTALGKTSQPNEGAREGMRLVDSLSLVGGNWVSGAPTPGMPNLAAASADHLFVDVFSLPSLSAAEGTAGPQNARISLRDASGAAKVAAAAVTVQLSLTDSSEFTFAGGATTLTVTIPAGASVSPDFPLVIVNDAFADGEQTGFIHAATTVANIAPHTCWVVVTDNDSAGPALTVTEVNGHITNFSTATPGADANGDGLVNGNDQFIEIRNTSAAVVELSGMRIVTNSGTLHTFVPCTFLCPGQAVVVFEGGVVAEGITTAFGTALAFNANGTGSLAEGVDSVRIFAADGTEVGGAAFHALEGGSSSILTGGSAVDVRFGHRWQRGTADSAAFAVNSPFPLAGNPALTGTTSVAGYSGAAALSSPGTTAAGAAFFTAGSPVALATCGSVSQLRGPGAGTLVVSRPAGDPLTSAVSVCVKLRMTTAGGQKNALVLNGTGVDLTPLDAAVQTYEVEIPAGTASVTLRMDTNPCAGPGGSRTPVDGVEEVYTVSATSCLYQNTNAAVPASITVVEPDATVTANPAVIFDAAGSTNVTVTLASPAPAALTVDLFTADYDAANAANAVFDATLPCIADPSAFGTASSPAGSGRLPSSSMPLATLTIPAGAVSGSTPVSVLADAALLDNRVVRFTAIARCANAAGVAQSAFSGIGSAHVVQPLVINEVSAVAADANGDGAVNAGDNFIEIVSNTNTIVDLSGMTLENGSGTVLHTFPDCSQLCPATATQPAANGVAVVFGGGTFEEGITALAGNALAQKATSGSLPLAPGTVIRLKQGATVISEHVFSGFAGGSDTRRDATAADGLGLFAAAGHHVVNAPAASSAGRNSAGAAIRPVTENLTVTFPGGNCIPEVWGLPFVPNAGSLTITRTGSLAAEANVCLTNLNRTAALLGTEDAAGVSLVTIPAGDASVTLSTLKPVNTTPGDGDLVASFRATAGCYLNGAGVLTVKDSGTLPATLRASNVAENAGQNASSVFITGGPAGAAVNLVLEGGPVTAPVTAMTLNAAPVSFGANAGILGAARLDVTDSAAVEAARPQQIAVFSSAASGCLNSVVTINTVDSGASVVSGPHINEIDYLNPAGIATNLNFVELRLPGATGAAIGGYSMVQVNPATGLVVAAVDLTAGGTGEFFVAGHPDAVGVNAPGRQAVAGFNLGTGGAIAIYRAPASTFPVGAAVTANLLVDAALYGTVTAPTLAEVLTPGMSYGAGSGLPITGTQSAVTEVAGGRCAAARNPDASSAADLRNTVAFSGTISRSPGFSNTLANGSFLGWAARHSLTDTAFNADTDGDGVKLLMEYAFGGDPTTSDASIIPLPVPGPGGVTLTVPVGAEALCDSHVNISAESSEDLAAWLPVAAADPLANPLTFTVGPVPPPSLFMRAIVNFVP